jgi:hypothetical protein
MKRSTQKIGTSGIALFAGLMDSLTGVLLMTVPLLTLRLMGVEAPSEAVPYVRFMGAFIFAVGSLYLWGLLSVALLGTWKGVFCMYYATAWIRAVIGVFSTVAILSGGLGLEWGVVPLTDISLAIFQVVWLLKGGIPRHV